MAEFLKRLDKLQGHQPMWAKVVRAKYTDVEEIALAVLIQECSSSDALRPFMTQLLWRFSMMFEKFLGVLGANKKKPKLAISFDWGDPEEDEEYAAQDLKFVCQYVLCGSVQMGELQDLGATTDGGWAHSWKLLSTQFFNDGFAVQAVPGVPFSSSCGCLFKFQTTCHVAVSEKFQTICHVAVCSKFQTTRQSCGCLF